MPPRNIVVVAIACVVLSIGSFFATETLTDTRARIPSELLSAALFLTYAITITAWTRLLYLCWFRWWFASRLSGDGALAGSVSSRILRVWGWVQVALFGFGCAVLYIESVRHLVNLAR
jgi:hypothetical protein